MSDPMTTATFLEPIIRSLLIALTASVVVLVLGTLIAHFMARRQFRGKIIVETLVMMPLVLPPSVVGFGLLVVFGRQSPIGRGIEWLFQQPIVFTVWAAVIAASVVSFPLIYQTVKNGFEAVDETVREAAAIDGAGRQQLFFHIDLRLTKHALITGALLAFARSMGEFGATLMVAGNIPGKTQTMATAIYVAVESNHLEAAWGWVISTLILSFILLFFVHSLRKSPQTKPSNRKHPNRW